ncbi:hypothetical protein GE061_011712 [Apolygus lucorum]|uniref:Uncharacterized protein n=1 Tax=Apolygus lucorum TaxID=248454 RepID=A0A6A4JSD5_APOLU|nr:hypothetical protein GE061_011712 [Apolygus lucorum]
MKRESLTLGLAVLLVVMLQSQATYLVGYPDDYELGPWYYGNDPNLDALDTLYGGRSRDWIKNTAKKGEEAVASILSRYIDGIINSVHPNNPRRG